MCLVTPMTLVGWTALSVEINTKLRTPNSSARSARHLVPKTLFSDRLADVGFHQRHVLVGGGVEDHLGTMLLEDLLASAARLVTSAMQACSAVGVCSAASSRSMAKMRFSPRPTSTSDSGLNSQDLPADFRADAAAGAGDHDRAPFEQLADVLGVQVDRVAAQEVVDFDVADGDAAVAVETVFERADDLQVQAGVPAGLHQAAQPRSRQRAGDHQHVGGLRRPRRSRGRLPTCRGSESGPAASRRTYRRWRRSPRTR